MPFSGLTLVAARSSSPERFQGNADTTAGAGSLHIGFQISLIHRIVEYTYLHGFSNLC